MGKNEDKKNLTDSSLDRQNILNNKYALEEIQKATGIHGVLFENELKFVKSQLADFFEIDNRTIDRYLKKFGEELKNNGYEVLIGNRLNSFKIAISDSYVNDTNVVKSNSAADINVVTMSPKLGVFNFRAFLNIGMLLVESEKARLLKTNLHTCFFVPVIFTVLLTVIRE
jgi:hypothetical protein